MTEKHATSLAWVLNGKAVPPDPGTTLWAVTLTREDGKFIHIDEDGGVIYEDERHGLIGDDPSQQCDTSMWWEWDGSEEFAQGLAYLLQGADWHTGGNNWVCLWVRPDGKCAAIGADVVCLYDSLDDFCNNDSEDCYQYRDLF